MLNRTILKLLFVSCFLLGCQTSDTQERTAYQPSDAHLAKLTDYKLGDGFITIRAIGFGCTFFNSFKLQATQDGLNKLEVVRTQEDKCGMKPRNVSLQYSYKHLGLDLNKPVEVVNPVILASGRKRDKKPVK